MNIIVLFGICSGFAYGVCQIIFGFASYFIEKHKGYLIFVVSGLAFCFGGSYLLKHENEYTVDSHYLESLQKEVRLHYPELKKEIHETATKNETYSLTIGQFENFKNKMKAIDVERLNDDVSK